MALFHIRIFPYHFALQCADVDHKWVTSGLLLQQESLQIRSNVKNLSYHKDKPVYSVKEQYYYSVDRAHLHCKYSFKV